MAEQYYEPETIRYGNAIIRVHIPILTEDEEAKRMEAIHDATTKSLKKVVKARKKVCQKTN